MVVKTYRDFPGGSIIKTLPSNAGCVGSILGRGAKIPHAVRSKKQNIKQKHKEKGRQRMRLLHSINDSMDMNLSKLSEIVEDRVAWCATVHGGLQELDTT